MRLSVWLLGYLFLQLVVSISDASDPYQVLGVRRNADASEIKKAYKKLARYWFVYFFWSYDYLSGQILSFPV